MVLFFVLIVCTVTLPPGVNPIAVDKYIFIFNGKPWSENGPKNLQEEEEDACMQADNNVWPFACNFSDGL